MKQKDHFLQGFPSPPFFVLLNSLTNQEEWQGPSEIRMAACGFFIGFAADSFVQQGKWKAPLCSERDLEFMPSHIT